MRSGTGPIPSAKPIARAHAGVWHRHDDVRRRTACLAGENPAELGRTSLTLLPKTVAVGPREVDDARRCTARAAPAETA
jgi:hypothetical protein